MVECTKDKGTLNPCPNKAVAKVFQADAPEFSYAVCKRHMWEAETKFGLSSKPLAEQKG